MRQVVSRTWNNRHSILAGAGMVPAFGIFADAADTALYAFEGNWSGVAWGAGAMVPGLGQFTRSAQYGRKALRHSGAIGQVFKKSRKSIVIGEGMADVKATARVLKKQGVNAKWYQAWGKNFPKDRMMTQSEFAASLKRNERWIKSKINKGYDIYSIGIDANKIKRGPYYQLEINILKEMNYPVTKLSR